MRLATIWDQGKTRAAVVVDDTVLPLPGLFRSVRDIALGGQSTLRAIREWMRTQPPAAYYALDEVALAAAVTDPGAIYTIGLNYRDPSRPDEPGPARPLVYGKAAASVIGHRDTVAWDRSVTDNVDAEVELAVVMGAGNAIFGYTIVNDISSRDEWLDGDQWLLGKSMPGFCPVGPWVVSADELDVADVALGCTINDDAIQEARTSDMRFSSADVIEFVARHVTLRPGDLIATGTPARLATPPGPSRRLQAGDEVTCWVEGIGELTNTIG
jgi:2-keto-4-pentenoate hydratase/2-oxohepta-3-ene-1,7-dioic acid hydratase in catechol pathway